MNKLIKLSNIHYVVVDDFEIKEGNFVLQQNFEKTNTQVIKIEKEFQAKIANDKDGSFTKRKITHSTQPLEEIGEIYQDGKLIGKDYTFDEIERLSLSEVEEAIYGYSVEKMGKQSFIITDYLIDEPKYTLGYKNGFRAHQELVKDKLFTVDETIEFTMNMISQYIQGNKNIWSRGLLKKSIQSLLPKTEWDIEFDEQGKIKLI